MYDLQYVKKRRRRKIAAFVSLFAGIGITSLVIVSFLGRTVGTFSVSISNSSVKLSLSDKLDFKEPTSYLRCDQLLKFREYSFTRFGGLDGVSWLDDENVTYDDEKAYTYDEITGKPDALYYFKYTFYVRNMGSSIAQYSMSVNISDNRKSNDETGRTLDDTLRVMVFENDAKSDKHEYKVFAKDSHVPNYDIDGNPARREFVILPPEYNKQGGNYETTEYPLAKKFSDAKYVVKDFAKGDIRRYTIVIWLEGDDPDADPTDEPPEGATVKLGVDIAAYENVNA